MLAGDSMSRNNNQAFSTKDRDNEFSLLHCAKERRSGWWHRGCTAANLNSQFYESKQKSNYKSIYWYHWRKLDSIKRVEMKIKQNYKSFKSLYDAYHL